MQIASRRKVARSKVVSNRVSQGPKNEVRGGNNLTPAHRPRKASKAALNSRRNNVHRRLPKNRKTDHRCRPVPRVPVATVSRFPKRSVRVRATLLRMRRAVRHSNLAKVVRAEALVAEVEAAAVVEARRAMGHGARVHAVAAGATGVTVVAVRDRVRADNFTDGR
jgi:hypothetical protein